MSKKHITSSNAVVILTVEELYPNGVQIQKFATDAAFATSDLNSAEARMGVDGKLAVGYTPNPINVSLTLEADSPSYDVFSNIFQRQQLNQTVYTLTLQISIPALGKDYTLDNGALLSGHILSDAKKVLDPTTWTMVFESFHTSSI